MNNLYKTNFPQPQSILLVADSHLEVGFLEKLLHQISESATITIFSNAFNSSWANLFQRFKKLKFILAAVGNKDVQDADQILVASRKDSLITDVVKKSRSQNKSVNVVRVN